MRVRQEWAIATPLTCVEGAKMKLLSRHLILAGIVIFLALRFLILDPLIPPSVCKDGWPSPSIGHQGACSHHHGVATNWIAVLVTLVSAGGGVAVCKWLGARHDRATREERARFEQEQSAKLKRKQATAGPGVSASPVCPSCGSTMRLRLARKGRFRGQQFWGCRTYPRCKGVRAIPESGLSGEKSSPLDKRH